MPTGKIHTWMVQNLEEPFYKAEMHRTRLSNKNTKPGRPKLIVVSMLTLVVPMILLAIGS